MTVEFLLVLFFQTKDDLNGTRVHGGLPSGGAKNTSGVLEDVRGDGLAIHGVFSNTFLVTAHLRGESGAMWQYWYFWTHQVEDLEGSLIDFTPAVRNDANDNLLPAVCAPCTGSVAATEVGNVLQNPGVWYQY